MSKSVDCLGLGIAPADLLMQIVKYPKAGAKIDSEGITIQGGGPIPTAMVALSRLGMKTSLITAVGDDAFGRFIIDELKREKVDTSDIVIKKGPSAIACGWVEKKGGRRTNVLDRNIIVSPNDIKLNRLPKVRVVHLDGRDMAACMKLARWAKKQNVVVSFDIGSIRNDVAEILPLVDHLVCAEDFALPYTKSARVINALGKLQRVCHGTIVITSGIRGAVGMDDECGLVSQKAFKVKAVDTTGAGDVYHGAYLFGLLKGWKLKRRMEFASAAAAIKCKRPGGRTAAPDYRKVLIFLKKGPAVYV